MTISVAISVRAAYCSFNYPRRSVVADSQRSHVVEDLHNDFTGTISGRVGTIHRDRTEVR